MNETNLWASLGLAMLVYTNSVRTTNWVNTGDSERKHGTNYVEQWMSEIIVTDSRVVVVPVVTVTYQTNPAAIKISREVFSRSNSVPQMNPSGAPPLPPTPGVPTKI